MADVDIDPFGEHESRPEEPTDEHIPLDPVTPGRSTWEPECKHETSFGSPEVPLSRGEVLHKEYLVREIYELIGNKMHQRLEPNLRLFELLSSMAWVKRCYSAKLKNLNKLLVFGTLYP